MEQQRIWVRNTGGTVQIGRFVRLEDRTYQVSWDNGQTRNVSQPPTSAVDVIEGSLRFLALTDPDALDRQFATTPAVVIRELLQEEGRSLDEAGIRARLTKQLGLAPKVVSTGWAKAEPLLRVDPHVIYGPMTKAPSYEWSEDERAPEPHAALLHRPWRFLVRELPGLKLEEPERAIITDRLAVDRPDGVADTLVFAALEFVDWPGPELIASAIKDPAVISQVAELSDSALKAIRSAARAAGRTDVLWLLAATPRYSRSLTELSQDLGPVADHGPLLMAVVEGLLARVQGGRSRLRPQDVAALLRRLPPCRDPGFAAKLRPLRDHLRASAERGFLEELIKSSEPVAAAAPLDLPAAPEVEDAIAVADPESPADPT